MATLEIPAGTWTIDPVHSVVGFWVRHMMVSKVRGRFGTFSGDITIADDAADSSVEATVDMASVSTGDDNRDQHLRTSDFFDIENFPTMTFRSTAITGAGSEYEVTGDLTIRGVTKPVTFDLEFGGANAHPMGGTVAGFTASANIDRTDFGLEYNAVLEAGGFLIGNKVTIELDIEATLASDEAG